MFPLMLDLAQVSVLLAGADEKLLRRLKNLDASGAQRLKVFTEQADPELRALAGPRLTLHLPTGEDFTGVSLLLVAGLARPKAASIAELARKRHILVNVEDDKIHCDFYYPSVLRRGDLVVAVSTGGKSPTLARVVRERIEDVFGKAWAGYTHEIAQKRLAWRAEGRKPEEVESLSRSYIEAQGWLKEPA